MDWPLAYAGARPKIGASLALTDSGEPLIRGRLRTSLGGQVESRGFVAQLVLALCSGGCLIVIAEAKDVEPRVERPGGRRARPP